MDFFNNMLRYAAKSTRKESIEAVGGVSAVLIGIIAYFIQEGLNVRIPPFGLDPILKSVMLSQIGILFTIYLSLVAARDRNLERLNDLVRNIRNILPADSNVKKIGKIQTAHVEINEIIRDSKEVKNTCVFYISSEDRVLNRMIKSSDQLIEDIIYAIEKNECDWKELISDDAEERAKSIMRKLTNYNNHFFTCRKLKIKQPIINFIIITPEDRKKDKVIYFGFGFHDNNPNGLIYETTDRDVIITFESYYDLMFSGNLSDVVSL